jgi:hypothetical protein
MAALKAALDPLSAPRPATEGQKDERSPAQRRADGMADLVTIALRGDGLPKTRGNRTHMLVVIGEQNLRTGRGLGRTGSGEDLTAAALQRIGCDAMVTPIRIDGNGVPLAVGRTRRTVTPGQWAALVVRDRGCIFPGCTRPRAGARPTTRFPGRRAARPTWTTPCCSATTTTTPSTTTAGTSSSAATGTPG